MSQEEVCRFVIYLGDRSSSSSQTFSQPTLNPDSSGRKDIVYFDRLSIKFWKSFDKEDVVAFRHVQAGIACRTGPNEIQVSDQPKTALGQTDNCLGRRYSEDATSLS